MEFADSELPEDQEARIRRLHKELDKLRISTVEEAAKLYGGDVRDLAQALEGAETKEQFEQILKEWEIGHWYSPLLSNFVAQSFAFGYGSTGLGDTTIDFTSLDKKIQEWIDARVYTSKKLQDERVKTWMTDQLQSFLRDGKPFNEFRQEIELKLADAGITDYKSYHVETVFNTEQAVASNYGRFESQMDVGARCPIWEFYYVDDDNHQEGTVCYDVAEMGGFSAAWDDPIWETWYPPCHFNCRSSVNALPPEVIERDGITVSPQGFLKDLTPQEGFDGPAWDWK